jgi:enamine deaminase RidA (YjgF/YER057c/UK114 family)
MSITIHQPEGREAPRGYSEATSANGLVCIAGQLAAPDVLESGGSFAQELISALGRFVDVAVASGASTSGILLLRIYVTSVQEYMSSAREFGKEYKQLLGGQFPATTLVEVSGFIDPRAKIEIEGLAVAA